MDCIDPQCPGSIVNKECIVCGCPEDFEPLFDNQEERQLQDWWGYCGDGEI